MNILYLPIDQIQPYHKNAKLHTQDQINKIILSIQQFGMNDPIALWKNNQIIEGHGRLEACKQLGFETVPVIRLDHLTDEQRRAYMLVHNKVAHNTGFDYDQLFSELNSITDIDMDPFQVIEQFDVEGLADYPEKPKQEKAKRQITCPYCGEVFEI